MTTGAENERHTHFVGYDPSFFVLIAGPSKPSC